MSGFEKTEFGGLSNVTTEVHVHFGARDSGGTVGVVKTEGAKKELVFDFTEEAYNQGAGSGAEAFLVAPKIPKGGNVTSVYMEVEEAFTVTGTSPTVEIGTDSSEATNGFTITEAQLEATGVYDLTSALSGTWADILAAETTVGVAMAGTSPVITSGAGGKARIVISYDSVM